MRWGLWAVGLAMSAALASGGVRAQGPAALPPILAAGPPATIASLDGDWQGTLEVSGMRLRLVLHVKTGPDGASATLDSLDQMAMGLPVGAITRDGAKVAFDIPVVHGGFEGVLGADGTTLTGQWRQGPASLPLVLTKLAAGQAPAALNRPQTPVKPYPYREEEVAYDDGAAGVRLAGALTLPQGAGPFPAVVLVAGSGPNTRDEPILGHRIFLVLADHLTRNGVAVLRYDKRGTGQSGGTYASATTLDFAADAEAGMAYLRSRPEIDPRRLGLIGHSEGGLIVPIVATRDAKAAFIVMMAGPGVDGVDLLMEQGRLIAKAMGMSADQIAENDALRAKMFAIVRGEKDHAAAAARLRAVLAAYAADHQLPAGMVDAQLGMIESDWFRFFFDYDPAPVLRQVRCPVLAINGALDLQVAPDQNLPPIRAALAGNPDAEVDELPGLNHLFQTARTGAIGEYGQIEETIAPLALDTMTRWITRRVGEPPR